MKTIRSASILFAIAAFGVSITAQGRMTGKVADVIDGRTVTIDNGGRMIKAEIRYIEVPEPEQKLSSTVREHLEKLTLGKMVEFRPHGFAGDKVFGQLFIGDLDIAVQMLRDGAAWHVPADRSGQGREESETYNQNQVLALLEKRGVWGISGLKPAWEFRAEKAERTRLASVEKKPSSAPVNSDQAISDASRKRPARAAGFWSDTNPWLTNPGPLMNGYNAASKTGYVGTSFMTVKEQEGQPLDQKTAVDVTYLYKQTEGKGREGSFVMTVVSTAGQERFLKANNITVIVDEKNYPVSKPKRTMTNEGGKIVEKLTYEMNKATIERIVFGGEVFVKIGDYMVYPTSGFQLLLYNMLQVAG